MPVLVGLEVLKKPEATGASAQLAAKRTMPIVTLRKKARLATPCPPSWRVDQGRANAEVAQDVEQANYEEGHAHQPELGGDRRRAKIRVATKSNPLLSRNAA